MPPEEDQNSNDKATQFDYDSLSQKITEGLREEIDSKLSAHHTKLDEKLSSLKLDKSRDDSEVDDDEDPDDDLVVSKKDLKKLVAEELKKIPDQIKSTVNESLSASSKKHSFDEQAFVDFPMLSSKSPVYSKDFLKAVQDEMKSRVADGDNQENPRLVYDSAAAVYARSPKYQSLKREYVEEKSRQMNNREGSFDFSTRASNSRQSGASESQLKLAKALGMDPEKVKERLKKK